MVNKDEFPGNSIKRSPVPKVTVGKVRKMEEPVLYKIFGGETASTISSYILWDVLIPALKSTITDIINNTTEMIFYGSGKRSRHLQRDRGRSYVSYNSIYDRRGIRRDRDRSRPSNPHRFEDVIFETRSDAEEVLSTLVDMIEQYDLATVDEFYEACGLQGEFTDNRYGWESLAGASVIPIRGGYILDLPKPKPI